MGQVRRWITIAAVIGVLVILAVVLYLLLEPLHRDDEDDARAMSQAADIALSAPVAPMSADHAPPWRTGTAARTASRPSE